MEQGATDVDRWIRVSLDQPNFELVIDHEIKPVELEAVFVFFGVQVPVG